MFAAIVKTHGRAFCFCLLTKWLAVLIAINHVPFCSASIAFTLLNCKTVAYFRCCVQVNKARCLGLKSGVAKTQAKFPQVNKLSTDNYGRIVSDVKISKNGEIWFDFNTSSWKNVHLNWIFFSEQIIYRPYPRLWCKN